ncbi:hypothetical protein LB507_011584 [Fusarium sp. FIESC RH6]|nr:hypothetical protein LB507_011584 [Fusarium sp. FIESC RH6]
MATITQNLKPHFQPYQPKEGENYLVEGIKLKDGEKPHVRQELRDLAKDEKAFELFLLGLWQFQLVPQDQLLSYYQIAGIHGLPYEAWPKGDPLQHKLARTDNFSGGGGGFCTHSSILFLTWHRPYLSLFETVLREAMIHVAKEFAKEGNNEYLPIAEKFRLPYWDWALPGKTVFPDEAIRAKYPVNMPKTLRSFYNFNAAGDVTISNPLYAYRFGEGTVKNVILDNLPTTTRYHLENTDKSDAKELERQLVEYVMEGNIRVDRRTLIKTEINLAERLVYILQSYDSFSQVSQNKYVPKNGREGQDESFVKGRGFGSLEDIHNTLHVYTGGTSGYMGHMNYPPYAAFDPIFWMHHANIDRLLAIWQVLHGNAVPKIKSNDPWVTPRTADGNNWLTKKDMIEDENTPLLPFYENNTRADQDKFWKSSQVHDTARFGYAYPETLDDTLGNSMASIEKIKAKLREKYASASLANMAFVKRSGDSKPDEILQQRAAKLTQIHDAKAPNTTQTALALNPDIPDEVKSLLPEIEFKPIESINIPKELSVLDLIKDNTYLEWLVNIKAEKHAFGGQYTVHVFVGDFPEDESPALYGTSPFHVGTFSPFGQGSDTSCGKCKDDQADGLEITGQIPLTISLVERYFAGQLSSLDVDAVENYLVQYLHWEVVDQNGTRLKPDGKRGDLPGLLVGVVSNKVTLPQNANEFPSYSEHVTVHPKITTRRDGTGRAEGTGVTEQEKLACC